MDTYQYTEIHANELEIPKYCIRFLFIHLIVRKNGISCKLMIIKKNSSFSIIFLLLISPYLFSS